MGISMGEVLKATRLTRNGRVMDKFDYGDEGQWPIAPDGSGATLAKRDQNGISDGPGNWTSSVLIDGTPGGRNFPAAASVLRRTLVPVEFRTKRS